MTAAGDDEQRRPVEALGYGEAVDELETILSELEVDDADVDLLADRVRRAAELIRVCRQRIDAARFEVEQVVAELDAEPGGPGEGLEGPGGPGLPADDGVERG